VLLHRQAPPKPPAGEACNGCGVCCAAEPCPLGAWLSRRRSGPCAALSWDDTEARYRCAALLQPARWLPLLPTGWARRLARRWVAAGQGCDCSLQAAPPN
jgi:hypothetical protein